MRRRKDYVPKDKDALYMYELARCSNALYEAFLKAPAPTGEMLASTIKDVRDIAMAHSQTLNQNAKHNETLPQRHR